MKILAHARNLQLELYREYDIMDFMMLDVKLILLNYYVLGKAKHNSAELIFSSFIYG